MSEYLEPGYEEEEVHKAMQQERCRNCGGSLDHDCMEWRAAADRERALEEREQRLMDQRTAAENRADHYQAENRVLEQQLFNIRHGSLQKELDGVKAENRALVEALRELIEAGNRVADSDYTPGDDMDCFLAALNRARAALSSTEGARE